MRFRATISVFPLLLFFLLVLLMMIGQLPSFSHGRRLTEKEMARSWGGDRFSSPSAGYYYKISPSQELGDDDFSPQYGVSKRLVPQGPNPLHN